jgi:hypothetical protein
MFLSPRIYLFVLTWDKWSWETSTLTTESHLVGKPPEVRGIQ